MMSDKPSAMNYSFQSILGFFPQMVRKEFLAARQKCDEDRRKERNMYQRMVNGLGADSKEEDKSSV